MVWPNAMKEKVFWWIDGTKFQEGKMQEQEDKEIVGMKGVLSGGQEELKKLKESQRKKIKQQYKTEVLAEAQGQKKRWTARRQKPRAKNEQTFH